MQEWTPGPWRIASGQRNFTNAIEAQSGRCLYDGDDGWRNVATYQDCCASHDYEEQDANREANGRRIVAAVNACNGVPTEALERLNVQDAISSLVAEKAALMASCEHFLALYDEALSSGRSVKFPGAMVDAMRVAVARAKEG